MFIWEFVLNRAISVKVLAPGLYTESCGTPPRKHFPAIFLQAD